MASNRKFAVSRLNGKSDAQVVIEMMREDEPGTLYTFDRLIEELQRESPREFSRSDVCGVIARSLPRVERELKRTLVSVRDTGYRLALASDHVMVGTSRKARADKQLKRGLSALQNVRWDEMTEDQRRAHTGTLLIVSALHHNMSALDDRLSRVERAVSKIGVPEVRHG